MQDKELQDFTLLGFVLALVQSYLRSLLFLSFGMGMFILPVPPLFVVSMFFSFYFTGAHNQEFVLSLRGDLGHGLSSNDGTDETLRTFRYGLNSVFTVTWA